MEHEETISVSEKNLSKAALAAIHESVKPFYNPDSIIPDAVTPSIEGNGNRQAIALHITDRRSAYGLDNENGYLDKSLRDIMHLAWKKNAGTVLIDKNISPVKALGNYSAEYGR
jgi:hypothetical protein